MSRTFTGSNNTNALSRTITNFGNSAFSVGAWLNFSSYATGRGIVGAGSSPTACHGLTTGAVTAQRIAMRVDCATADVIAEVAAPNTGGWYLVIGVQPTSVNVTSSLLSIYLGDRSTPMALTTHATDANGSGAISSQTAGFIGKTSTASTAMAGSVFAPFVVPFAMTLDQCERFRQGDWAVLFAGGSANPPRFFVPLNGGSAATYDLAVPGAWTVTNSPTVSEDPPVAQLFPQSMMKVSSRLPTLTAQPVDGAMTPSGLIVRSSAKSLSGAFT